MSFFDIFKSSIATTKSNLEKIQAYEVQNRIDGNRDVYQQGDTIHNYFYSNRSRVDAEYIPPIDAENFSKDDRITLGEDRNTTYCGVHTINGVAYDFGGFDSDDITIYNDLPQEEKDMYGSHDNWVSGTIGEDYFQNSPELIAEHGSYKNMIMGVTVEDKIQKSLSYKVLGRIPNSIKKEATVANQARGILQERKNAQLLADTERFKRKSEKQMKREADVANKHSDVANLAKEMKAFNDNMRMRNQQQKEQVSVIDEISKLKDMVIGATSKPQISAKSVADELMQSFRSNQRHNTSIIDTRILTR